MELANNASEKLFESKVKQLAVMNGWHYFHTTPHQVRPGVFRSDGKGFPDLTMAKAPTASHQGGLIFAELKIQASTAKASKEQLEWLRELAPWAEVYLWRPNQLSEIAERLGRAPK